MVNLFLILIYQRSKLFHSQAWFIYTFVGWGCFSKGFMIFMLSHCFLEIVWCLKASDVSTTHLGENRLVSPAQILDSIGSLLLINNSLIIRNIL